MTEYICELINHGNGQWEYEPTGQEVVRCKDCNLFYPEHEGGIGSCGLDMNVTANDYCSKAERKYEVGE